MNEARTGERAREREREREQVDRKEENRVVEVKEKRETPARVPRNMEIGRRASSSSSTAP